MSDFSQMSAFVDAPEIKYPGADLDMQTARLNKRAHVEKTSVETREIEDWHRSLDELYRDILDGERVSLESVEELRDRIYAYLR